MFRLKLCNQIGISLQLRRQSLDGLFLLGYDLDLGLNESVFGGKLLLLVRDDPVFFLQLPLQQDQLCLPRFVCLCVIISRSTIWFLNIDNRSCDQKINRWEDKKLCQIIVIMDEKVSCRVISFNIIKPKIQQFFVLFWRLTTLNHDKVICYAKTESVLTLLDEMVAGL